MSVSLPSRIVYAVDVPEVQKLSAKFVYNFFVTDEGVSDIAGIPTFAFERRADDIDASFVQYSTTRVPRYVSFEWTQPRLVSTRDADLQRRDVVFSTDANKGSLISDNVGKIISEDDFASKNFVSIAFTDGEIDDKLHQFVSASCAVLSLGKTLDHDTSDRKTALGVSKSTNSRVPANYTIPALAQPSRSSGTKFHDAAGSRVSNNKMKDLKDVTINVQINSRFVHDIVDRTLKDPNSQTAPNLRDLHRATSVLKSLNALKPMSHVSESDFKTFVPFVDVNMAPMFDLDSRSVEIVGYVIDKTEMTSTGAKKHPSLIVDNPRTTSTVDFRIKYNATYVYAIRTIAQFTIPAIDDDSGALARVKVLVSSKPKKVIVNAVENVAPPPPVDVNFMWNYERTNAVLASGNAIAGATFDVDAHGSLMIYWSFPPNSQRDVKRFQVFRRASFDQSFELIKEYDFDDSALRLQGGERPHASLVERLKSPRTFYYDDDFRASHSKYIYAIACIDAHGLTSNYSTQFEVWFDLHRNMLMKRLVSHSGAPKPYPNLYLEADTFVDTIRSSGPGNERAKLYFNPEMYYVIDDDERRTKVISTKQDGASYRLHIINLDNQHDETLTIDINDMRRPKQVSFKKLPIATSKKKVTNGRR